MTKRYEQYLAYLESNEWKELKHRKFLEVGKLCQNCPGKGQIHVHHIRYREFFDCLTSDLIVLCETCHNTLHVALKAKRLLPEDAELERVRELIHWYNTTPESARRQERIKARRAHREKHPTPYRHKKQVKKQLLKEWKKFQGSSYPYEMGLVFMEKLKWYLEHAKNFKD